MLLNIWQLLSGPCVHTKPCLALSLHTGLVWNTWGIHRAGENCAICNNGKRRLLPRLSHPQQVLKNFSLPRTSVGICGPKDVSISDLEGETTITGPHAQGLLPELCRNCQRKIHNFTSSSLWGLLHTCKHLRTKVSSCIPGATFGSKTDRLIGNAAPYKGRMTRNH